MGFRVFVGALVILVAAGQARAAGDGEDLIRQGVERRRQRDDAGALRLFEQAYLTGHSPRALAQMGLAEQALGKWVSASEHLRQALAIQGDAWIAKNRGTLTEAAARVAEHVGWIEVSGGPSGAEVRLDGVARGMLPLPRPLAAPTGSVAIDLSIDGSVIVHRTTTVRAGETTREDFEAVSAPATALGDSTHGLRRASETRTGPGGVRVAQAQPAGQGQVDEASDAKDSAQPSAGPSDSQISDAHVTESHAPSVSPSAARIPLVVATGVLSAGALVFAVVEHTTWYNKAGSFGDMMSCNRIAPNRGATGCQALYDDGQRARLLAFVGYGAAAALAATSVILFFALDSSEASERQVACSFNPARPSVACAIRF